MAFEDDVPSELKTILEKASDFHGHLGPFLTVGVRMGLVGLDRIGAQLSESLRIVVSLPLHVPFSCVVDGLQATTKCTIGNQKLSMRDAHTIQATFETYETGQRATVALNQLVFQELKSKLLKERLPDKEIRKIAWKIATLPEEELFVII